MYAHNNQYETISLADSEENDLYIDDINNIDAEIVDYGVLEDEFEDTTSLNNDPVSVNTSVNNVINKQLLISVVDCNKYPWYYKKYRTQILEKINQQKKHNFSVNYKECDDINEVNSPIAVLHSSNSIENVSNNTKIKKIDEANKKRKAHQFIIKRLQREDKEIVKALQQRNKEEIDFKKNKGLIGMKIKTTIAIESMSDNKSNEKSKKSKKHLKSKEIRRDSVIKDTDVILVDGNTTISVKHTNKDTHQKASNENKNSKKVDTVKVLQNKGSNVEYKCKIPMEYFTKYSASKEINASERKQGQYDSIAITQHIMDEKKKDINKNISQEKCKNNSNQASGRDKKTKKDYKTTIIDTQSFSPMPKSKKIQLKKQMRHLFRTNKETKHFFKKHARESKKDQALIKIMDEKQSSNIQKTNLGTSFNNEEISDMLNTDGNRKATIISETRPNINNVAIPDVIRDCDTLASNRNLNTSTPNLELTTTDCSQPIKVITPPPSPIQSNFKIYNHKTKPKDDSDQMQDIPQYQSKLILSSSDQNKSPNTNPLKTFRYIRSNNNNIDDKQKTAGSDDRNALNNNSTVINKNLHSTPRDSVPLQNNEEELTKQTAHESQPKNRANLKRKANVLTDPNYNNNNNNTEDILIMKLKARSIPKVQSMNFQNENKSIDTLITERNTAGYKSNQRATLYNHIVPDVVQPPAGLPRPYKVMIGPMSFPRGDFRPNIIRAPMFQPPLDDSMQFRHQMPLQQMQPPPRYSFQAENACYRMPDVPCQNEPARSNMVDVQNCMQQPIYTWNVQMMPNDNMNMPPGISDVRPEVRFPYPPPPVPQKPPAAPYFDPNNGSIIGRNPEGFVKKINLMPNKQTMDIQTNLNVSENQGYPNIEPYSATSLVATTNGTKEDVVNLNYPIASKKHQTNKVKNIKNGLNRCDLKRLIEAKNQEKPRYKPSPRSKEQKQNAAQNNESTTTQASCKRYSSPILPIPTYDLLSRNLTHLEPSELKRYLHYFDNHLHDRHNQKKAITKKISLGEYKKRALLKDANSEINTTPLATQTRLLLENNSPVSE